MWKRVIVDKLGLDAAEFKESDHPRQKDGKFGTKGVASPITSKGAHIKTNSFVLEHILEGKHSEQEVKQAALELFGAKTVDTLVSWAKKNKQIIKEKKPTNEAEVLQAAFQVHSPKTAAVLVAWAKSQNPAKQAEIQAGVKANDTTIMKMGKSIDAMSAQQLAKVSAEVDAELTKAEKPGHKTFYVHAKNSAGKSVYFKLTDLPEGVANSANVSKYVKQMGYTVSVASPWDASKPTPPGVYVLKASPVHVQQISDAKYAEAAKIAEAKKPFTEIEEELPESVQKSIKHYTNGSYQNLNASLRKGVTLTRHQAVLAANLDTAINKSKLSKDCTIYRKIEAPLSIFGPSIKVGGVWVDNGYISTSKNQAVWEGNIKLTIDCKKGGRGIDVQALSLHTSEAEVLLPRGSLFKIKKVNGSEINLEYLG